VAGGYGRGVDAVPDRTAALHEGHGSCCGRVWAESGKVNRSRLALRPRAWGGVNGFPAVSAL
jgi:hypothetical protein